MEVKLKTAIVVAYSIAILFFCVAPVPAYVLQGRHVLDLMIEKLGPARSLFVSEKLIIYRIADAADVQDSGIANDAISPADISVTDAPAAQQMDTHQKATAQVMEKLALEGSLRYVFPRAFRSDARSLNSERIHIAVGGRTLTIIDGNIAPDAANSFDIYKDILLYRSREMLVERLLQLNVDISISSLGRFEDKIAFVLGANYPNDTLNQLWVDKDTLLPLRLIIRDAYGPKNSDMLEMRYLVWWKIGQSQYPSRIEFYQNDSLVRVNLAQNFEENATFSNDLFDIEQLKMTYPQAPPQSIAPEETAEPSEIQKTIEDFRRIFE